MFWLDNKVILGVETIGKEKGREEEEEEEGQGQGQGVAMKLLALLRANIVPFSALLLLFPAETLWILLEVTCEFTDVFLMVPKEGNELDRTPIRSSWDSCLPFSD